MPVWRSLDTQQQLGLAAMILLVVLMVLNELERLVNDRMKDRRKQKVVSGIIYFLRQMCCIATLITVISINMVLRGKWL